MSKYTHITKDGIILEVGYDSQMDYVFVQVIKNNDYLYSNLNDSEINFTCETDFTYFDKKMKTLGLEIPEELKVKTLQDRTTHIDSIDCNIYERVVASYNKVLNEESDKPFAVEIYQTISIDYSCLLLCEFFYKESEAIARVNQINGSFISDFEDL